MTCSDLRRGDHRLPRRPGGAQEHYGVTPDLTTLAKILAGGLPGGCLAGRADLLRQHRTATRQAEDAAPRHVQRQPATALPPASPPLSASLPVSRVAWRTTPRPGSVVAQRVVRRPRPAVGRLWRLLAGAPGGRITMVRVRPTSIRSPRTGRWRSLTRQRPAKFHRVSPGDAAQRRRPSRVWNVPFGLPQRRRHRKDCRCSQPVDRYARHRRLGVSRGTLKVFDADLSAAGPHSKTVAANHYRIGGERTGHGQQCAITGKKPVGGNKYTHRGKAKYLGGVGRRSPARPSGVFKPNLQRVKVEIDGTVQTIRVAASAIRSGLVKKPVKRKPFQMPNV